VFDSDFVQGYVKRQALYACLTCTGGDRARAGVCLACTYACHSDHDLVELYTKRNFRCDCGNSLFDDADGKRRPCTLTPDKDPVNDKNQYNQNFDGVYCVCSKPYPCDEYQDVEMVQCCLCEDWYHTTVSRIFRCVCPSVLNF
jgi:E3 ubiquitin-protein ligase UBR7